jgi:TPR repeat protein
MAQYQLGIYHNIGAMGLERNKEKAFEYWEKAAEGGDLLSMHNLGCKEMHMGNLMSQLNLPCEEMISMDGYTVRVRSPSHTAAMRHWCLVASGGKRNTMKDLITDCFEKGLLHHADLAETLQAMYRARAELKSEDRDKYIEYTKMTGEYTAEYDDF